MQNLARNDHVQCITAGGINCTTNRPAVTSSLEGITTSWLLWSAAVGLLPTPHGCGWAEAGLLLRV
jgi:hypothetical protein